MMRVIGDFLERHRNSFLVVLLVSTFLVSGRAGRTDTPPSVSIPVISTAPSASALEVFRQQRSTVASADIAALEALIARTDVDSATRASAADQLMAIIADRQSATAIEGALVNSSLAPCVAVVSNGFLTLVTGKSSVTAQDSALVTDLAALHANIPAENIRILTAE